MFAPKINISKFWQKIHFLKKKAENITNAIFFRNRKDFNFGVKFQMIFRNFELLKSQHFIDVIFFKKRQKRPTSYLFLSHFLAGKSRKSTLTEIPRNDCKK